MDKDFSLDAVVYGDIFQKGVRIVQEMVSPEGFEDVFVNGFKRGLDYHAEKHGYPKDEHSARSRVSVGVAMAQMYVDGKDLDKLIEQDGNCYDEREEKENELYNCD